MALTRSVSQQSTLSLFVHQSKQYSKWMGLCNVLVLLASLIMIFCGVILKLRYHMNAIGYISTYFAILPLMMIVLGVLAFLTSAFGLIVSATESKPALIGYAIAMAVTCLGLFGKIHFILISSEVFFLNFH